MDDTVTRNVREAARGQVDLVQRRNEELVRVLLRITRKLGRSSPSGGQERNRAVRKGVI